MFGVSLPELVVVFTIALLVFGPDKLPELARTLGKISAQLRRQSDSVRREFYNTVYKPADDFRASLDREARSLMAEPLNHETDLTYHHHPNCSHPGDEQIDVATEEQNKEENKEEKTTPHE